MVSRTRPAAAATLTWARSPRRRHTSPRCRGAPRAPGPLVSVGDRQPAARLVDQLERHARPRPGPPRPAGRAAAPVRRRRPSGAARPESRRLTVRSWRTILERRSLCSAMIARRRSGSPRRPARRPAGPRTPGFVPAASAGCGRRRAGSRPSRRRGRGAAGSGPRPAEQLGIAEGAARLAAKAPGGPGRPAPSAWWRGRGRRGRRRPPDRCAGRPGPAAARRGRAPRTPGHSGRRGRCARPSAPAPRARRGRRSRGGGPRRRPAPRR